MELQILGMGPNSFVSDWDGHPLNQQNSQTHSRPKKILFCIDGMGRGGTELQLEGLIQRLDRSKFVPYLCIVKPEGQPYTIPDCETIHLGVSRVFGAHGLKKYFGLVKWMKKEGIDIVQTFFQDSTLLAGIAARHAGVPIRVAGFRDMGFWQTRTQEFLMNQIYPQMTGYIANAQVVKDHYSNSFGIPPKKIQVIHNGIDSSSLPFNDHDGPTLDIGIVGNLNRSVKRTDLFIKAAGTIAQNNPGVRWHIVGDGNLRVEFESLGCKVGLSENLIFTGRIDDVPSYLDTLQVGVICSDSEGLSNAILEYMFKGTAVVATNVGGNSELVSNKMTGLIIPPDNVEDLAVAMQLLIDDTELRKKLAKEARLLAEEQFGWTQCVSAHESYYSSEWDQIQTENMGN